MGYNVPAMSLRHLLTMLNISGIELLSVRFIYELK